MTFSTVATFAEPQPSVVDSPSSSVLRLALPKGRMQEGVFKLLEEAGMKVRLGEREYRPTMQDPGFESKILKPQNIVEMLHMGSRDLGFAGADWVAELDGELVDLLDTGLDPVRLVAAAPANIASTILNSASTNGNGRPLIVASEYVRLANRWIVEQGLNAQCVRSYGATEAFPPEDADCIIDNTATGSTLKMNGLAIIGEVMRSSTRLYANPRTLDDPAKRNRIETFTMLLRSVLEARKRVMLELNVSSDKLESIVQLLPSMREPTISPLYGQHGYAVKAAVLRSTLATLIPELKRGGGTDIVISSLSQIVA